MPCSASLSHPAFYLHQKIFNFPHSKKKGSDKNLKFDYLVSETNAMSIGTADMQALP